MVLPASSGQHKTTTTNGFINGRNDATVASIRMPESTVAQKRKMERSPERDRSSSEASLMLHDLTEMKEKLIHDLRASVDGMIDAILEREKWLESLPTVMVAPTVDAAGRGNILKVDERKHSGFDKKEIVKFCVPLSKEEIEEDLMKMVGRRSRQRPKGKPKALRMKLDDLIPCPSLTEYTID